MSRHSGLTLLELLLVVAAGAILATLAVPAFKDLILDARMTGQVNRFIHGIHAARGESAQRGVEVALCRSSTGRQCSNTRPWREGWIVFVNRDHDDPPMVDAGERILQVAPPFAGGTITANRQAFVFRPFGRRAVNGTLVFCDRRGPAHARRVVVSYTGRPRAESASAHNGTYTCVS